MHMGCVDSRDPIYEKPTDLEHGRLHHLLVASQVPRVAEDES